MLLTRLRIPASNALISSVPNISNFHNLALFICQLLIDGRFRSGHILNDPNVFDGRLITEIESICPRQFPWQISDISQPFIPSWESHQLTDNILQLIFCDPKFMSVKIYQFKGYFIHYQIFIFSSIDETDTKGPISVIKKLNPIILRSLSTLVLHYNTENGLIHVHSKPNILTDGSRNSEEPLVVDLKAITIRKQNIDIDHGDLFDRTFGNYERKQSIVIGVDGWIQFDQLRRLMALIFGLRALAMVIIILERIISKWLYWRGCRIHYFNQPPNHNPRYRNILNHFRRFIGMITNRFRR